MATEWNEEAGRWFVDGKRVNAGDGLELQGVIVEYDDHSGDETKRPGEWFRVRIESRDEGRELDAWKRMHGVAFCSQSVAGFCDGESHSAYAMRWPRG